MNDKDEFSIEKRRNETTKQFEFRKKIYDNIYEDTKSHQKALIYSNIWYNILSLNCTYPDAVMKDIMKYKPDPKDNVFIQSENNQ
jgi:hypothetical protein